MQMLKRALRGLLICGNARREILAAVFILFNKGISVLARAAHLPVFSFLHYFLYCGRKFFSIPGNPWERQLSGRDGASLVLPVQMHATEVRPCLPSAGATFLLLIYRTVQSTATIPPEGCINPCPQWEMTSAITTCAETVTQDSLSLKKWKAFDNTIQFSGVPCSLLITTSRSPQIPQQLQKAFADNKQKQW